jgi:hypothetical protein
MKDTSLLAKIMGKSVEIDVLQTEAYKTLSAEFETFKADANALVESYTTQVGDLTTALATATEQVTSLTAALAEANAEKTAAAEAAAAQKTATRKEKIVALVGEDKADALLQVTSDMDDPRFDTFMTAIGGVSANEAKSPLFTEAGVTTEVEAPKTAGKSKEMLLLEEKYGAVQR